MKTLFAAVLMTLSLAACATSDITALGQDTYMVTAQSRFYGNNGAAANGVLLADAYCKERGKRMQMSGAETSDGVIGVLPAKSVVMFKCIGSGAPTQAPARITAGG